MLVNHKIKMHFNNINNSKQILEIEKTRVSYNDNAMRYITLTNNGKPETLRFLNNNIELEYTERDNRKYSHLKNDNMLKINSKTSIQY